MINQSQGFPYSRLMSVAGARGSRVVTNEEMTTIIDSTDEWIQQRTGIKERRWVGEGETVLSLAVDAGRRALEKAGIPMASAEVTMIPQNYVKVTDETALKGLQRTLDLLDEDDDVQAVYHNWDEE